MKRCQAPGCLCDVEDDFWPGRLLCEDCWDEAKAKKWHPMIDETGALRGWLDMSGKWAKERNLDGKDITVARPSLAEDDSFYSDRKRPRRTPRAQARRLGL